MLSSITALKIFRSPTRAATEIVSLPMFPQLSAEQQAKVVAEIRLFTIANSGAEEEVSAVEHSGAQ